MKKLFLVGALALTGLFATAQEGLKGTWFVGGQVAFGNDKTTTPGTEVKTTTILPIAGTFISPSVAVGAGVGYMGGTTETDVKKVESNNFVIKPLVRKYWNISGGLFFFGQAALPMIFGNTETTYYDPITGAKLSGKDKLDATDIALELSPGFDYVVNKWMTIETSFTILSVGYSSRKPDGGKTSDSFDFNANPFNSVNDREWGNLQLGVKFLF